MTEREEQQRFDSPLVSERGSTTIKDAVVSRLAGMAAGDVEGVRMGGSASRTAGGILDSVTGSQGQSRGVSVEVGRTEAAIDLTMGVVYGGNILELVGQVRDRITERIEYLTGLRVTELNVTVNDIVFPDEESDGEEGRRRELEAGPGYEDQPQAQQTEEPGTGSQEREAADTERVDLGAARAETITSSGRGFSEETLRAEDAPEEDATTELRLGDEETDETRRRPTREDEPGRERDRDR